MYSRVHLPDPFQKLMTDEDSEIIDFYPEEFSIDMNGKKMLWQGVALLPFIDETRLLDAMAKKYPELSEEEHRRNGVGNEVIFVNEENKLYDQISSLYMKRKVEAVSSAAYERMHIGAELSASTARTDGCRGQSRDPRPDSAKPRLYPKQHLYLSPSR